MPKDLRRGCGLWIRPRFQIVAVLRQRHIERSPHAATHERSGECGKPVNLGFEPSVHRRAISTLGTDVERDGTTLELPARDPVDQRAVVDSFHLEFLRETNRANARHLPIAAPSSVLCEDLEADAAMQVRVCVMGDITELASNDVCRGGDGNGALYVDGGHRPIIVK